MSVGLLAAAVVVLAGAALRPAPPARAEAGGAASRAAVPAPGRPPRWTPRKTPSGPDEVARWCTDLARAVRSGATLTAAIRSTPAPAMAAEAVAALQLALDRGSGLTPALEQAAAASNRAPDLQLAFTVLHACAEHGGPPGEPLDRAASTLRARAADLADRRTHSAQARLSAVVMTWLPLVMLGLLLVTSAPVRGVTTSPAGASVVAAGAALNFAGWRWMNRIIGGRQ